MDGNEQQKALIQHEYVRNHVIPSTTIESSNAYQHLRKRVAARIIQRRIIQWRQSQSSISSPKQTSFASDSPLPPLPLITKRRLTTWSERRQSQLATSTEETIPFKGLIQYSKHIAMYTVDQAVRRVEELEWKWFLYEQRCVSKLICWWRNIHQQRVLNIVVAVKKQQEEERRQAKALKKTEVKEHRTKSISHASIRGSISSSSKGRERTSIAVTSPKRLGTPREEGPQEEEAETGVAKTQGTSVRAKLNRQQRLSTSSFQTTPQMKPTTPRSSTVFTKPHTSGFSKSKRNLGLENESNSRTRAVLSRSTRSRGRRLRIHEENDSNQRRSIREEEEEVHDTKDVEEAWDRFLQLQAKEEEAKARAKALAETEEAARRAEEEQMAIVEEEEETIEVVPPRDTWSAWSDDEHEVEGLVDEEPSVEVEPLPHVARITSPPIQVINPTLRTPPQPPLQPQPPSQTRPSHQPTIRRLTIRPDNSTRLLLDENLDDKSLQPLSIPGTGKLSAMMPFADVAELEKQEPVKDDTNLPQRKHLYDIDFNAVEAMREFTWNHTFDPLLFDEEEFEFVVEKTSIETKEAISEPIQSELRPIESNSITSTTRRTSRLLGLRVLVGKKHQNSQESPIVYHNKQPIDKVERPIEPWNKTTLVKTKKETSIPSIIKTETTSTVVSSLPQVVAMNSRERMTIHDSVDKTVEQVPIRKEDIMRSPAKVPNTSTRTKQPLVLIRKRSDEPPSANEAPKVTEEEKERRYEAPKQPKFTSHQEWLASMGIQDVVAHTKRVVSSFVTTTVTNSRRHTNQASEVVEAGRKRLAESVADRARRKRRQQHALPSLQRERTKRQVQNKDDHSNDVEDREHVDRHMERVVVRKDGQLPKLPLPLMLRHDQDVLCGHSQVLRTSQRCVRVVVKDVDDRDSRMEEEEEDASEGEEDDDKVSEDDDEESKADCAMEDEQNEEDDDGTSQTSSVGDDESLQTDQSTVMNDDQVHTNDEWTPIQHQHTKRRRRTQKNNPLAISNEPNDTQMKKKTSKKKKKVVQTTENVPQDEEKEEETADTSPQQPTGRKFRRSTLLQRLAPHIPPSPSPAHDDQLNDDSIDWRIQENEVHLHTNEEDGMKPSNTTFQELLHQYLGLLNAAPTTQLRL